MFSMNLSSLIETFVEYMTTIFFPCMLISGVSGIFLYIAYINAKRVVESWVEKKFEEQRKKYCSDKCSDKE